MNCRLDKRDRGADGADEREAVSAGQAAVKKIRQILKDRSRSPRQDARPPFASFPSPCFSLKQACRPRGAAATR